MKQILTGTILLALTAALLMPSPATAASNVAWSVGSAFQIGGASFHIAVRDGYYGGAPYYYRTRRPIQQRGYACGSACFRAEAYYYHDPYCPLATAYFSGYGHSPYNLYTRYGPRVSLHIGHGVPWGPGFIGPGPPIYPPYGYSTGPIYGYYAPYGYNLDRRGSRYERYDVHGDDGGNHKGRGHDKGHD